MSKTRFTYIEWHWTREYENLFLLSTDDLWWFRAFIAEAERSKWDDL